MTVRMLVGDALEQLRTLPDQSVRCCVTSPPYFGLRDYGVAGQIGTEDTLDAYLAKLVAVFAGVRRVLTNEGTLWLNLGDSYASAWPAPNTRRNIIDNPMAGGKRGPHRKSKLFGALKEKDLMGVPWRVAFALQADGWYLRSDIIWYKPNPMPESVTDRPTRAHEYLFLLAKSGRYHYDAAAIAEPALYSGLANQDASGFKDPRSFNGKHKAGFRSSDKRNDKQRGHSRRHVGFNDHWDQMEKAEQCSGTRNKRDVWTVATAPFRDAHFATFPPALIEPCILAGSAKGDTVLDPFGGAGTTGLVADRLGRNAVLIELNPKYAQMAERRIHDDSPLFSAIQP